jgi:hypothetical protein
VPVVALLDGAGLVSRFNSNTLMSADALLKTVLAVRTPRPYQSLHGPSYAVRPPSRACTAPGAMSRLCITVC